MFIKVKVQFEVVEGNNFTLSIGSNDDQTIMQFASNGTTVREDLFDLAEDTQNLQVSVLSEGESSSVDHLDISVKEIVDKTRTEWMLLKEQYKITIIVSPVEHAPADWFDTGVSALAQENKPWYLTAEDLYKCTKDLMLKLTGQVSAKTAIPSEYFDNLLEKLDFVTAKVAEKLLHIQLEEGFSFVAKIDELLEQVLSSTDEHVDEYRLKLALKLQQLRKSVTVHLQEISHTLSTKKDLYRAQVEDAVSSNKAAVEKSVATAYSWAADTSSSTSNWLAQAEHTAIINKIDALRLSGKEVLEQTQNRVLETRDQVVSTVNDTRDQMVNTVNDTRDKVVQNVHTKLSAADEALRVQLPTVAHPYVVQAVAVSQPYVETAVTTATPYIQSVRDQESVKKLESWVMDKKKDELMTLLEKNKDTPAGSMVSALLSQASQVITEVTDYCLNEDYFDRNKEQKVEETAPATTVTN
mmetsp:Transcript_6844/g.11379  ORF Transcript_6844/g.11379 Transcript_6844/m.11379 type:complete len:468 (-) Transcript_6844:1728-3131(-)|eukprot:CAMPEP_0114417272 /NCGR_PEP_ID=MMETSP0103-20121206/2873_1 /TAXON_ID=37642 ORGANISM="Paraphysomonas imperforata, Strain PA2" /NCGR_SAMPLE_ID=MMETSP0103 /ASSEMBLY_ACC=CAM_ASM_000201 /LENGTH=467 /DNA_ID=CAMNT_0001585549 /DNA_START=35 /DNA_END=1438 /DNA_ORIENTATION=-